MNNVYKLCLLTEGDDFLYTNWYQYTGSDDTITSEPNDYANGCMVIDPSINYQWRDSDCNAQNSYICARGNILITPITQL